MAMSVVVAVSYARRRRLSTEGKGYPNMTGNSQKHLADHLIVADLIALRQGQVASSMSVTISSPVDDTASQFSS